MSYYNHHLNHYYFKHILDFLLLCFTLNLFFSRTLKQGKNVQEKPDFY